MAMVGSLQIVTQSSPPTITVTNVLLQFKIVHLHAVLVIRLNYGIVILLYYCSGTTSSQIKGKKSLTLLLLCLSKVGFYTSLPVDYEGMLYLGSKSWLWSKSNFLPRNNYWLWCVLACNNFFWRKTQLGRNSIQWQDHEWNQMDHDCSFIIFNLVGLLNGSKQVFPKPFWNG